MSEIDKLLDEAEALQEGSEWEPIEKYQKSAFYVDDDSAVNIERKQISAITEHISVQGEQNSQYIEFIMDRYSDGVDLAEKTIAIHYEVGGAGGETSPVNVYKNESQIKFGWIIGPEITQLSTSVDFCIWVRGTLSDGKTYVWKTLPQSYKVREGLVIGGGIVEPDNNWYMQFSLTMDEKVSLASESANAADTTKQEVFEKAEAVDFKYEEVKSMHQEAKEYMDGAETYRNEAEEFKNEASRIKDQVEQMSGVNIANVNTVGVSKPDGETIDIDEDGTLHCIVEPVKNYEELENKPTINGVEVAGNLTQEDLNLNIIKSYSELEEKPKINGVEIDGELSLEALNIASTEDLRTTNESIGNLSSAMNESMTNLDSRVNESINNLSSEVNESINNLGSSMGESIEVIENSVGEIEKAVGELETSISTTNRVVSENSSAIQETNVSLGAFKEETSENIEVIEEELNRTTYKVDTLIERASLGMKNVEVGETIHLADSEDDKITQFSLYGNAIQNTTTGKNLLKNTAESKTADGLEYTVNADKSVTINGILQSSLSAIELNPNIVEHLIEGQTYRLSGSSADISCAIKLTADGSYFKESYNGTAVTFTYTGQSVIKAEIVIRGGEGTAVSNVTFYPMITLASITEGAYEPYTGGVPAPNANYIQEIAISGKSNNLLNVTASSLTKGNVKFTVNSDKSISINGTASEYTSFTIASSTQSLLGLEKNKKYVLSKFPHKFRNDDDKVIIQMYEYVNGSWSNTKYTYASELEFSISDSAVGILIQLIVESGNFVNTRVYPMIRLASIPNMGYELYGNNSIQAKGFGKNCFNMNDVLSPDSRIIVEKTQNSVRIYNPSQELTYASAMAYIDYTKMRIGRTYTFSAKVSVIKGVGRLSLRRSSDNRILNSTSNITTSGEYKVTFTLPEYACYISLFVTMGTSGLGDMTFSDIQIEEGTVSTSYESFKECSSTIQTPNGLVRIPTVTSEGNYIDENGRKYICDEIVKFSDGTGERIQRIKKIVYDGVNVKLTTKQESANNITYLAEGATKDFKKPTDNNVPANIISSHFTTLAASVGWNNSVVCITGTAGFYNISLAFGKDTELTTVDLANEWLKSNNVTVYYELAEPIRTPLTAEEVAEIEKLQTFYPATNLLNDGDCKMMVTYSVNAKNYIDNKLAQIASAVLKNI